MSTSTRKTLRRVVVLATAHLVHANWNVQGLKRTQHIDCPTLLIRAVQTRIACERKYDQAMLAYNTAKTQRKVTQHV